MVFLRWINMKLWSQVVSLSSRLTRFEENGLPVVWLLPSATKRSEPLTVVLCYSLTRILFLLFPSQAKPLWTNTKRVCVTKCAWQPVSVSFLEHWCELVPANGFWCWWGGWRPSFCCVCCWLAKPQRPGSSVTPRLSLKFQNSPEMILLGYLHLHHPKCQRGHEAPPRLCAWSPQKSDTPSSTWTPSSPAWSLWWASLATRRCSGSYTRTSAWGTGPMSWLAAWLWETCSILSLPSRSMCLR